MAKPFQGSLVQYRRKDQVVTPSESEGTWSKRLGLYEFKTALLYKAAAIEFIGTSFLTFTSCAVTVSILTYGYAVPPQFIAIVHIAILAFFILASAKSSGGHLNPMISFSTVIAGFTTPSRALVYIIVQTAGAIVGAGLLRGVLDGTPFGLGGCQLGRITEGRALLAEAVTCALLLFIVFGTALDVGQREVFGPVLGPFFVSTTLALVIYFGGGLVPGYTGPSTNPARCFGPAVITGNLHGQWVFWVGALIGACLIGTLYRFFPPGFNERPATGSQSDDHHSDGL